MRNVVLGLALLSIGCGTRIALVGTDRAPSVGGELVVEELTDEQRSVDLDVYGLPTPESRAEGATVYVVWLVSEDAAHVELAGRLEYDTLQRAGELSALTLMPRFALIVTAEASPSPSSPSDVIVLKCAYPADVVIPERYRRPQPTEVETTPAPPPAPPSTPVQQPVEPAPAVEPATVEPASPPATL